MTQHDPARAVQTRVFEQDGQWSVEILVIFREEVVRKTIQSYRTRRRAEIAASWIQRAAERDIEGPVHG